MDLRVYVDGVARIICDLTRTTTVHDIIIALAQYKGKAGRYSLIQRAPDGTQRTLSPNELTCELIQYSDWIYILQQNPSNKDVSYGQRRSKSLDGRKTPIQQTVVEKLLPVTSSTDHIRTVQNNKIHNSSSTLSSQNKKSSNIHQIFSAINTNNSNNNIHSNESPSSQKRLVRTPIHNSLENHHSIRYSRPKSTVPPSLIENSAFHIVPNQNNNHISLQQQQQQYVSLVQILKKQEIQVEQQQKELNEKQKEIDYREVILHQSQFYQDSIQHELKLLEEQDRRLFLECQTFAQEYSTDKFDIELEYNKNLHTNYEHLQQQLTRCSSTLEQKRQLQDQLQFNIEQIHKEIQQIQTNINNDKKEILQYQYDLDRSNSSLKQQENLEYILTQRNEDIEHLINKHQQQILELEIELIKLNDSVVNNLANSSYHFHPTSSSSTDILMPVHLQFMNSTLLKLCPSGIWV